MPTEDTHSRIDVKDDGARAGVERGSPSGLAARDAGAHRAAHPVGPRHSPAAITARGPHRRRERTPGAARHDCIREGALALRCRHARLGRAASVSRRRRLAPASVATCCGGREGDDPYLHEVRTPRLIRRGSESRRRDPTTPAAGSSAARAEDRGPGPRRARDRWGATVDRRDGVLDDPEAAAGDVRMRAHRRPLARSSWLRELDHEHEIAAERVAVGSDPQRLAVLH